MNVKDENIFYSSNNFMKILEIYDQKKVVI